MGATRHVVLNGPKIKGVQKEIISFLSSFISSVSNFYGILKPMCIQNNFLLNNGFNYSDKFMGSNDYLLISSWDNKISQSVVKLERIRDGKILYKWTPDIDLLNRIWNTSKSEDVRTKMTKNATELAHPLLMNDGSLIFHSGCIFKVDKYSKLVWYNKTSSHHSIELDPDGNLWICSYNSSKKNLEKYHILDDAIKKISITDGKILFEKSVFDILMENSYNRGYLFIAYNISSDPIHNDYCHLNDIQPVFSDSQYWKKGDLFISLRHQNLIMLYRPSINKIIWSQNGPWVKQHDVDILDSTRIGIFGNNVLEGEFANDRERFIDGYNKQYIYDFSRNLCSTPYDKFFESSSIATFSGGSSRILANGNIFVDETNRGRILYGNYSKEIWSYIEKIDEKSISLFNWNRYITNEEFEKFTFIDQTSK